MYDMRNYKDTVKAAVKEEREADQNWSWRVVSVTKEAAKIGWGYLDYLGEKELFVVTIEDDSNMLAVTAKTPDGASIFYFVGPERWDDCLTVEEGIALAIHGLASHARSVY